MDLPARRQLCRELSRGEAANLESERRERLRRSLADSLKALKEDDRDPIGYCRAARCHEALGQHEDAIAALEKGLKCCMPSPRLYREFIWFAEKSNRTEAAIEAAQQAQSLFPEDFLMKLKAALILPRLYDTPEDVEYYRRRFAGGLLKLSEELLLDTPDAKRRALGGIAKHVNFFLAYQGRNDRELQEQYGKLVSRIMAANYPQWTEPLPMPPVAPGGKIRIGYITPFFWNHTVTTLFLGWIQEQSRSSFDVYAYHVGDKTDSVTEEVQRAATEFCHFPGDLDGVCNRVRSDNLHVAVFLDVGMNPIMAQIASLRLAPIQCVAWGHPVTSGLPNADYFISSALMEPVEAQDHYSERLVCLPGIGISYPKPVIPQALLGRNREEFGIRADAIVYLSSQSTFKYRPEHDDVFAHIARRVPAAHFVFLERNKIVRSDFRKRLGGAFATLGLEASEYCTILPQQSHFDYWNLSLVSDVFLDSLEWSGGRSTMEAVACGLPVVTMPGRFMRGRHSYAILTQVGAADTIAHDKSAFIDIAARLGVDHQWRHAVVHRMEAGYPSLYSDTRCVRELEEFFRHVADKK